MPILLLLLLAVIAVIVLGWFVIQATFWLIGLLITGLIIGALARLVLPGSQPIGWAMTILAGIAGSLTGGIIASLLGAGGIVRFLIAIAVAAALIAFVIVPRRRAAF
jgi:uncharacterized membrane protein YeaQ/YmgE (transglycosylase-associated protein family)